MTKGRGSARPDGPGQASSPAATASAIASKFHDAFALHQQGQLGVAEALYREILQLEPNHFDALHMLGLAALQKGNTQAGIDLVGRAIQANPTQPFAQVNMGNALRVLQRLEEALASYDRAVQVMPDFPDALYNRSIVLLELKRPEQALASAERTLALNPDHVGALNIRGNALRAIKREEDALASYDRALQLKPDFALALYNRGNTLLELKRSEEALASYDLALRLMPDDASALANRGNALLDLGRHEDALASYDRALQAKPDLALALNNRGGALLDLGRPETAASCFAKVLEVEPAYDYALGNMVYSRLLCCDWTQFAQHAGTVVKSVRAGGRACVPFQFLAIAASPADQLQCARIFANDKHPPARPPLWSGQRYEHDKIRVAYLSADFHDHATAYLMAELFECHDTRRFEVTAISYGPDEQDEMRARLRRSFHRFLDVRAKSDREVALALRELEIDIAVDLKGFTTYSRIGILAYRPAPIQVSYLGYPGTLGTDYFDYILADRHVIPEENQVDYAEKVVYLPGCYQVNDSKRKIATHTPTRAQLQLPEKGFVFCCFNNNYKITPEVFGIWMRLLSKVDGSVLWLIEGNAAVSRNLRKAAAQRGVAAERLVFAPRMKLEEHLARHRLADLFLDTLPYNAHTTASDALWAGLPVLTCMGSAFAGRVAASLLHAVGLPQLITRNLEEYEELALKLATTTEVLPSIRAKLTANPTALPLFDADRFRLHLESAFTQMWERQRRGEPPAGFSVGAQGSRI